ncbi:hypothetical protein SALBM311S_05103 [Streptomyces alboniger]
MSEATTRSWPASAAIAATKPVPQPISRNELPVRAPGRARSRNSIPTRVDGENTGAKTSGNRSHSRSYIVKTQGRSSRVSDSRLRPSERS